MMGKRFRKSILVLICLFSIQVWAQEREVTGEVFDTDGIPLPGVNVFVENTSTGTVTDFDGQFSLSIPDDNSIVLVFSSLGFQEQKLTVEDRTNFSITMQTDTEGLDEVVVVGYGSQRKANLTGAVSTVDTDFLESRPVTDAGRALQGTTPGLQITTNTGRIGEDPQINLRGSVGSLGSEGGAQPLILVDNVEVPNLQVINPEDIESISVLKDAASTSIYGARAAWGVILVTTKKGAAGKPRVTYSNNLSWATPTEIPKIAPAAEGAEMAFSALQRTNPNQDIFGIVGMSIDQQSIARMRDWDQQYGGQNLGMEMVEGRDFERRDGGLFFYRSWDPMEMFTKKWAPMQKHDFSVSGGTDKTTYYVGMGYLSQGGVIEVNPDQFNRYNFNMSLNTELSDWAEARVSVLHSNSMTKEPFAFSSATYDAWYYLTRWPATYPYGNVDGDPFRSHLAEVSQANQNELENSLTRINVGTTLTPIDNLTINMDYTHDRVENHNYYPGGVVGGLDFWSAGPDFQYVDYSPASYNSVNYESDWSRRNTGKIFGIYDWNPNDDNEFKFTAGGDMEEFEFWMHGSERWNLIDPDRAEIRQASGDQFVAGERNRWTTLGAFARINYSYKDKLLFELNGRYDGSSRLSPDEKWAFFPSASAGYILTEENYMDWSEDYLSFLKLRASYGSVGNQNTNIRDIYRVMPSSNSNWIMDGENMVTVDTPGAIPQGLTWETVTTLDIGMDARFFDNRLGFSFDWYRRTVSDMISPGITLPVTFGTTVPPRNFGELQTEGIEVAVDFKHTFDNGLSLNAMATLSDYQERITRYDNFTQGLPNPIRGRNNVYYEGMTVGEIWGYETDRLFTDADFNSDGSYADGVADQDIFIQNSWFEYGPGDVKYKDLNGDGVVDFGNNTRNNPGDQKVIGNTTPRYQYGIQLGADWKGFDLSIFMQGVGQRDMWADGPVFIPGYRPAEGWYAHQLDYWTPENTNAFYPRPTDALQQVNPSNFRPQTRYMMDMSYFRVKNATVGYSLPSDFIERFDISNFRIYFSGENLLEFTNLDVPVDPEVNYTTAGLNDTNSFGRVYPFRRTLSLGVQLTF